MKDCLRIAVTKGAIVDRYDNIVFLAAAYIGFPTGIRRFFFRFVVRNHRKRQESIHPTKTCNSARESGNSLQESEELRSCDRKERQSGEELADVESAASGRGDDGKTGECGEIGANGDAVCWNFQILLLIRESLMGSYRL